MLAVAAHPELILKDWSACHNACWELRVTTWADSCPRRCKKPKHRVSMGRHINTTDINIDNENSLNYACGSNHYEYWLYW